MAQLRRDYQAFIDRSAAVVVVGPDTHQAFEDYFSKHALPFIGIPDPKHEVLKTYGQQVKLFKLGRMPAQALIDEAGMVRFIHYGHEMSDIPSTDEMLTLLDELGTNAS